MLIILKTFVLICLSSLTFPLLDWYIDALFVLAKRTVDCVTYWKLALIIVSMFRRTIPRVLLAKSQKTSHPLLWFPGKRIYQLNQVWKEFLKLKHVIQLFWLFIFSHSTFAHLMLYYQLSLHEQNSDLLQINVYTVFSCVHIWVKMPNMQSSMTSAFCLCSILQRNHFCLLLMV